MDLQSSSGPFLEALLIRRVVAKVGFPVGAVGRVEARMHFAAVKEEVAAVVAALLLLQKGLLAAVRPLSDMEPEVGGLLAEVVEAPRVLL